MGDLIQRTGFYKQFEATDEYLAELCKYGKPDLCKMDDGWWCRIEMFISGEGISFEIDTPISMNTPLDAVRKCYELMVKALKELDK